MDLIQSRILNTPGRIKHAFFYPGIPYRREDNLSFKNGDRHQVLEARRRACSLLNFRHDHLTHVYQDHGTVIWSIRKQQRGAGALTGDGQVGIGDGMITNVPGIPLAILIADCLPILFSDRPGTFAGIAHAGWRGTLNGIAMKMLERLTSEFQVKPEDMLVWIGPGISSCCFHVGDAVWKAFLARWGHYSDCFLTDDSRIDLKRLNFHHLVSCGVLEENMEIHPDCTCCDRRYFSYRRDGAGIGHNMAVIELTAT